MTRPDPRLVDGLADVQRALRRTGDTELPKMLRRTNLKAAQRVVPFAVARARRAFRTRTGRTIASIRALASQRDARIVGGGARLRHFGWLDFGGTIVHEGPRHSHGGFVKARPRRAGRRVTVGRSRGRGRVFDADSSGAHLITRDFFPEGRVMYPSIDDSRDLIDRTYLDDIHRLLRSVFG